ncbi:hypothetical protein AB0D59_46445 [Streptomyces sp. NPDC048417]|uniref:hypothetical protein n=1 Tax=Streptomyces sp. NPDC048417 TaxID=3155387 RepID=UPI0034250343
MGDARGIEALRAMTQDPERLDVLDQWHTPIRMQMPSLAIAPIMPHETDAMRRDSRRDTKSKLEALDARRDAPRGGAPGGRPSTGGLRHRHR